MPRRGHPPEQTLNKLRQVEVSVANVQGLTSTHKPFKVHRGHRAATGFRQASGNRRHADESISLRPPYRGRS